MDNINSNIINVSDISRLRMQTDGEGVTTLVVSVGCPLRCAYCINPFTWDGTCEKSKKFTPEELFEVLKIDELYFLASGGGVMFGGGEPLLNYEFISEFIDKYKSRGWKFYMETSLSVPLNNLKKVADKIDMFFVDTKDMDKNRYEIYTRGDYDLFIGNLKYLVDTLGPEKIIARVPVIPLLHKDKEYEENVKALQNMGIKRIDVFRYVYPESRKSLSKTALERREEFEECLKKEKYID